MDDRISYTGFVFKLAAAAATWESKKQKTVALSSTEAEYMVLSDSTKCEPTVLSCENHGVQNLTKNPAVHCRTKHIDIRHY